MNCYQITLENFAGKVNQCLTPEIYPYGSKERNHPKVGEGETKPYLHMSGVLASQNFSTRQGKRSLHLLAKLWHFVR